MSETLTLDTFCLGAWQTNCYLVGLPDGERCWIVDAGFEPEPMIDTISQRGLTPERLILTHGHLDHIAGVDAIRAVWPDLPIAIHEADRDFLTDPTLNLSAMIDQPITVAPATEFVAHGQTLTLGDVAFEVRHTPGHSPGGITLGQSDAGLAIVGDTLFAGSIGRYDFPTSDGEALFRSIREQLLVMPDDTRILPGHGPATTIGAEKQGNPFL